MDVKQIAGQHSKSVALVFNRLGIKAPVTAKEIVYATLVYQGEFIDELERQLAYDLGEYTGFDDSEPAPHIELNTGAVYPPQGSGFGQTQTMAPVIVRNKAKAAKKTLWDVLGSVADAAGKFMAAKNNRGETVYVQNPAANNTGNNNDNNKWLLYAGIALVVILVIAVIAKSNK
jgi:hypothetical protein